MRLGVIADDVTGATDIASVLKHAGFSVILTMGVPVEPVPDADAIVVATKVRMAPLDEAKDTVAAALAFLRRSGSSQFYFKYCSTFDSTEQGNIGPLTDQLLGALDASFTIACPSYPALDRTVYQGHLFVGNRLLSESPMRHHPLTPMHDPDLVRFLSAQTRSKVGLLRLSDVEGGTECVRQRFAALKSEGVRVVITDALSDLHLNVIGSACTDLPLITGGAALAGSLARSWMGTSALRPQDIVAVPAGPTALLSGSCSAATLEQVTQVKGLVPSLCLDPVVLVQNGASLLEAIGWAVDQSTRGDFLIYSTAPPENVGQAQSQLGRDEAASIIETAFGKIACALAGAGVHTFVVAGGETSGAITKALGIETMEFGDELAPGVPWTYSIKPEGYRFALKSGNFGGPHFFSHALKGEG
jgi:3-dehydrotetronate 4-kinase